VIQTTAPLLERGSSLYRSHEAKNAVIAATRTDASRCLETRKARDSFRPTGIDLADLHDLETGSVFAGLKPSTSRDPSPWSRLLRFFSEKFPKQSKTNRSSLRCCLSLSVLVSSLLVRISQNSLRRDLFRFVSPVAKGEIATFRDKFRGVIARNRFRNSCPSINLINVLSGIIFPAGTYVARRINAHLPALATSLGKVLPRGKIAPARRCSLSPPFPLSLSLSAKRNSRLEIAAPRLDHPQ